MAIDLRVAERYKLAAESLWDKAKAELEVFQRWYEKAQRVSPESDEGQKLLGSFAFRKEGTTPTSPDSNFSEWYLKAFQGKPSPDSKRPDGRLCLEVADGKRPMGDFLKALDEYSEAINEQLRLVAPASLNYSGFQVKNPDHLSDDVVRHLLEGVDYLTGLFKKRGMEKLLHNGVTEVILEIKAEKHGTAHGLYYARNQSIVLTTAMLRSGPRLLDNWVNEVFLHEFGHYIHLNYIDPRAKEVWDKGWLDVKAVQEALQKITRSERDKFFQSMETSDYNPTKAVKKLNAVEKVKFGLWLRNPLVGDPLITPNQFRLTKSGERVFRFFREPERFIKDEYELVPGEDRYEQQLQRTTKQLKDKIGLIGDQNHPIPMNTIEELSEANPEYKKAVRDALDKLNIVSTYGETDEMEDFAETFVAFVGNPEKLTSTAKARMQQALWMSGYYGKPVVRLARQHWKA